MAILEMSGRLFERGYGLILSERYRKIRLGAFFTSLVMYPAALYTFTLDIMLTLTLLLAYWAYMPVLVLTYRLTTRGFGKSKFAFSLSSGMVSISSILDVILSFIIGRLVLFTSPLLFMGINVCLVEIMHRNDNELRKVASSSLFVLSVAPFQLLNSTLMKIPMKLYFLLDIVTFVISYTCVRAMLRYVEKVGSSRMLYMLYTMLESLGTSFSKFERSIRELGQRVNTCIHMFLLLREDGRKVLLLIPYLHFGPISGTCGSRLLHDIIRSTRSECMCDVVYMHGVGSHELDIVDEESCNYVLDKLTRHVRKLCESNGEKRELVEHLPDKVSGKFITITYIPLGEAAVAIVSRNISASDDIPLNVYRQVMSTIGTRRKIVIVDAQNGYEGESEWNQEEVSELATILDKLAKAKSQGQYRLYVGYSHVSGDKLNVCEVGPEGLTTLVLEYRDLSGTLTRRVILLIFDSNNMKRSLRDLIVNKLSTDNTIVEVLTMDDHELVKFVTGKGYAILGEKTSYDYILDKVRESVEQASHDVKRVVSITYSRINITPLVLGEEGFQFIKQRLSDCVRNYGRIVLQMLVLPAITLVITLLALALTLL